MALKRVGILTGGGDCSGLNAVIRAVTRTAIIQYGAEVVGLENGFDGLIFGQTMKLTTGNTKDILTLGGTILGTTNKGNPFDEVARLAKSRVKQAIVFGEAAGEIGDALTRAGVDHEVVPSMTDAVYAAIRGAGSGDNVVLSPACASFDEFDSFEHRGRVFKRLVGEQKGRVP